jgi:tetratricopeptide (TPR) repeat protein
MRLLLGISLFLSLATGSLAQSPQVTLLLARAHAQEQTGRVDLAAQTWQQVLLVDPNDQEALAGLARAAKLVGNEAQAHIYLQRLQAVNPHSPEIAKIESTHSSQVQNEQLQQAAKLAQAGQPAEALRIYRGVWGNRPPDGDWALAYYDTEASIVASRAEAIAGLRALAAKYPSDTRYSITLGRILTYNPDTRKEGLHLLQRFPQEASAQAAIRQALLWDAKNPNAAPEVRSYLEQHPDKQIAQSLDQTEQHQAHVQRAATGIAQSAAERSAFAALAAGDVDQAQAQFLALQKEQPENPRVLAGLGFLQMKQNNFAAAIDLLMQAEQLGLHRRDVDDALKTARFWNDVRRGTESLDQGNLDDAAASFKAALVLRPQSIDALNGLAGTYMKGATPAEAVPVYRTLTKLQPRSAEAWRGLLAAQVQAGQPGDALATDRELPPTVQAQLQRDPAYLRSMMVALRAVGRDAEAQTMLSQALAQATPDNGQSMKPELRLQYAGLLADAKLYAQAATMYRELLYDDPESVPAWTGLIAVQHQAGRDADAMATIERIAPSIYDDALADSGFLTMVASIYQQENRLQLAYTLLQRAFQSYSKRGQAVPSSVQLQMASVCLQQNHPEQAFPLYQAVLQSSPENIDAWKGLIDALHQTHRDRDALAELRQIPLAAQRALDRDVAYQQTVAGIYAATGNEQAALQLIAEIQNYYRILHGVAPADIDIQNLWLLYNTHDDADLYRALMTIGGRNDLSDDQRRTVQTIWATWSVRRAGEAVDSGNSRRAIEILTVAYQAFPDNTNVIKALAGGYLKAGDAKRATQIYIALQLSHPSAGDYQSMVGAALAAHDLHQAEAWLHDAMDQFPNDAQVLAMAARFEQARGDHRRAAVYLKLSLAALPKADATARLAHTLDQADAGPTQRSQNATLQSLLDPNNAVDGRVRQPALPSYSGGDTSLAQPRISQSFDGGVYGPDPYQTGVAPVQLRPRGNISPQSPTSTGASFNLPAAEMTGTSAEDAFAPPSLLVRPLRQPDAAMPMATAGTEVADASTPRSSNRTAHLLGTSQQKNQPAHDRTEAVLPARGVADSPTDSSPSGPSREVIDREAQRDVASLRLDSATPPPSVESLSQALPSQIQLAQQQPLPPLRGTWSSQQSSFTATTRDSDPRTVVEQQLATIDADFSPWRGGTGDVSHRSGTPGFDQLTILEAPFEASATVGGARLTGIVTPSVLDSGVADGNSIYPLGTLPLGATPAQQNAAGVGGEVQLTTSSLSLGLGTTPRGFLVSSVTGRLSLHPASRPLSLNLVREGLRDSQLAYAGLRDPATITADSPGLIWGGVVSNAANLQFSRGDALSGYYAGVGGQYITGTRVMDNHRIDGVAGAYWKVAGIPNTADVTLGANFFGMHYEHNLEYFTYGQGGYFSPNVYFLANMPFTVQGQYGDKLHYTVAGAIGVQAFQESSTPYYPFGLPPGLTSNPSYAAKSVVGGNYDLHAEVAQHVIDRWYIGGFVSLNNTRNYASQTAGFFIRYISRPQLTGDDSQTGLFPYQGLRPLLVP